MAIHAPMWAGGSADSYDHVSDGVDTSGWQGQHGANMFCITRHSVFTGPCLCMGLKPRPLADLPGESCVSLEARAASSPSWLLGCESRDMDVSMFRTGCMGWLVASRSCGGLHAQGCDIHKRRIIQTNTAAKVRFCMARSSRAPRDVL